MQFFDKGVERYWLKTSYYKGRYNQFDIWLLFGALYLYYDVFKNSTVWQGSVATV